MALSYQWKVLIDPTIATSTDFASRVQGLQLDQQIELNRMAQWRCLITLRNQDGALTPGGGGTYTSTDWFANMVRIQLIVTGGVNSEAVDVFHGIITGFDLFDDGTNSTVQLTCQDVWAVGGRTAYASVPAFASTGADTYLDDVATWTQFSGAWPKFGATTVNFNISDLSADPNQKNVKSDTVLPAMTYTNLVNNVILPGVRAYAWPTIIYSLVAGSLIYEADFDIGGNAYYSVAAVTLHEAATGTQIPFSRVRHGWTTDKAVNTATVTPVITGAAAQTSQDATQANKYGVRAVQYTQTAALTNDRAKRHAEWLANANSTPRFMPLEVTSTLAQMKERCSDAAYQNIASLFSFVFLRRMDVVWTGAGTSTQQTVNAVMLGRRITATPTDTTITLTLGWWDDTHNWVIGTDKLGVNRLG